MSNHADRASGIFFLLFGIALYFVIIPAAHEQVDDGWLLPDTLPNAVAIIMGLCGALLAFKPTSYQTHEAKYYGIFALYFGVLCVGLYLISQFGFLVIAPIMTLVVMFMLGERRALWLGLGVVVMPIMIWVFVAKILERAMP